MQNVHVDLCVIGGGSAGRTLSARAVALGVSTLLVEKERMGGDCLNFGCVPSKALLGAAHLARRMRTAGEFGIDVVVRGIDAQRVFRHVHDTIARIEPHDSAEHFRSLGVRVEFGAARFTGPRELVAGGLRVRARNFVIATGTSAQVPAIPGLGVVPFLTHRDVFDLRELPRHLVVVGAGPIGVELAQAFANLGSRVTLLEAQRLLGRDDPELVELLRGELRADGIEICEGIRVVEMQRAASGIVASVQQADDSVRRVSGSHLLIAAGRRPNLEGLDLEAAGVRHERHGIVVNARLQTSNPAIYAIGDCVGPPHFTHVAVHHADRIVRNVILRERVEVNLAALPWVTFTSPELARVGMLEDEARAAGLPHEVARLPYERSDRALAERNEAGLLKVVVGPKGRILGASALGPASGEIIQKWAMAMHFGVGMKEFAEVIAPYPTSGYLDWKLARTFDLERRLRPRMSRQAERAEKPAEQAEAGKG